MPPIRSLEQSLLESLTRNKARIKFETRFLLAPTRCRPSTSRNWPRPFLKLPRKIRTTNGCKALCGSSSCLTPSWPRSLSICLAFPAPTRWPWIGRTGKSALLISTSCCSRCLSRRLFSGRLDRLAQDGQLRHHRGNHGEGDLHRPVRRAKHRMFIGRSRIRRARMVSLSQASPDQVSD